MAAMLLSALVVTASAHAVPAETATASSTFSSGNLVGSPEYAASNALSSGSGYWSSSGSHAPGETITFTASLSSARSIDSIQINWAHAPGEVRILVSADGSNFEEAVCWRKTGSSSDSFVEHFQFNGAYRAKLVTVAMRGPRKSGYIAIGEVAMGSSSAEPIMLIAGVTSAAEMCMVTENGSVGQRGALVTAEACEVAIAAGDARDLWIHTESGQLKSAVGGLCAVLAGNSAAGGGEITLADCDAAAETGDGRSFWMLTPQGQLSMGGGSYCMVLSGGSAFGGDLSTSATISATATSDASKSVDKLTDASTETFWQSPPADSVAGPVSVSFDLAQESRVSSVVIEWNEPASDFVVQTSEDGGEWTTFADVVGNTLQQTIVRGSSVVSKKVRVLMKAPVSGPSGAYSANAIRIMSSPLKMSVQDCSEASMHGDARDLFFADPAPEFDPLASSSMRGAATMLEGALRQLGEYTSELSALKPKIEACKKA